MGDFFAGLPSWAGTLPQLITAISSAGILGFLVKLYLGRAEIGVKAQKIKLDAEAILRTHFSGELTRLSERLTSSENGHAACRKECEECRDRLRKLEDDYQGVLRIISFNSSTLLLGSDDRPSEVVKEAAIRVLESLARGETPTKP